MRRSLTLVALIAVLSACAGSDEQPSAEELARAWSRALNAGDNRAAGALFAIGAQIEQSGFVLRVRMPEDAAVWTASLACAGRIVAVEHDGDDAIATFLLSDRQTSRCDAPGGRARALFRVRDGKIVLFRQVPLDTLPEDAV